MEPKLTFRYDREADILHIDQCPPYAEQASEELGDEIVARLNPATREVENLEVLFFSTRLLRAIFSNCPSTPLCGSSASRSLTGSRSGTACS